MCGISAVFKSDNASDINNISLDKIRHRGSSNFESREFKNSSIGTNRLPIVGRSLGVQPISNQENTLHAIHNGEIFNYKILRGELINSGYIFQTESDTEVLVHGFDAWGSDLINKIDSEMFAFVIYNSAKDEIFAARDPLGVKPLYYAEADGGALLFASELKQLSELGCVKTIKEFPKGNYFYKKKFTEYSSITLTNTFYSEKKSIQLLEKAMVEAVRKRVNTDLPVGVFLSGGVDSSLVVEIANRFHKDVTAIILGNKGSSDHDHAVRLCEERGYKYHVVSSHIDYEQELDELLYHLETYEPNVIRHSFANWICSREAHKLGLKIVLLGEGADELFAGYNEFSSLSPKNINRGCKILVDNLHKSQLVRVDRTSMRFTIEARNPFLDKAVVDLAMRIRGDLKIKKEDHRITTKYILRKVASKFLPDYIAWRYKVPFANGAGMDVGYNYRAEDGILAKITSKKTINLEKQEKKNFKLETKEEEYYFKKFKEHNYTKLDNSSKRIIVKDVLSDLQDETLHRLVVAEFDQLALYFPVYLASEDAIFEKHGLDVDFIATGGDDATYGSLLNNSAQIGLSDPLFAMFEGKYNPENYGEIIGSLVQGLPLVAIALDPNIHISSIEDLKKYRIGSFQKYSTTHTTASNFLDADIVSFPHTDLVGALTSRKIDIAVVLKEQYEDIKHLGYHQVFDLSELKDKYLFTGLTVSANISSINKKKLNSFKTSIKKAMKIIWLEPEKALRSFKKIFPHLTNYEEILNSYKTFWVRSLNVDRSSYISAHQNWKDLYPTILKNHDLPFYRSYTETNKIMEVLNWAGIRREYPYREDKLHDYVEGKLKSGKPIKMYGFWGAGPKKNIDKHEIKTLDHLKKYINKLEATSVSGVEVTCILADKHAENNEYELKDYSNYIKEIKSEMEKRDIKYVMLSKLWSKYSLNKKKVLTTLKNKPVGWWKNISIASKLESRAENNFNKKDNLAGAQKYHIVRSFEKDFLEEEFQDHIYFVWGDSLSQSIYPDMPTLYLFTEKKYYSVCPWFNQN